MNDPLGLISQTAGVTRPLGVRPNPAPPVDDGPGFRALLEEQISKVNDLQTESKEALEDLVAGRRDDLEGVIIATQKADTAFKMLLQVRNKVMDAYEEVKQLRV